MVGAELELEADPDPDPDVALVVVSGFDVVVTGLLLNVLVVVVDCEVAGVVAISGEKFN